MTTESTKTTSPEEMAALKSVPARIVEAWEKNDADLFAAVFTEDASLILPGDVYLVGREQIRSFMANAYAGPFKGTRVVGDPLLVKRLDDNAALLVTQGGILAPGDEQVTPERAIRASWVLVKSGAGWLITGYQNTPIGAV
ncbi:SgcJ/EcaC family oxidoreductase [Nocardiopsis ansamitocini]|uniref:SnoaL-like domain-containing protein n=1 Tax=Nocardiopsis ansamitocini TaxID=1670832 RepID=A0A9W6UK47_9ACTN|nr:SgcJ/EcaC family oxidoreductase [Nocardiopsis ansamitocini]GLU48710.1 hypothetical protein Nans01_30610 [Nocardiopsis ansamitocini]